MDVRTRILESALTLLSESGVTELTQPKVSRGAGVTQSHLTYYFPTRADLLLAVARHAVEQVMNRLHQAVARGGSGTAERGAGVLVSGLTDKRNIRVMLGLVVASDEDRKIKASLRQLVKDVRAVLGQELRAMGAQVDDQAIAALHATAVGLAVLNLARDNEESRRDVETVIRGSLERLVEATPPRRGARDARKT
ncbi:MAG: TetR/AcrR family transcriptional regulator [Betaproteobacteria bacterium]|jgi:AcrR family transcriptional regulator|nr:TetR/AcrR family transcriptional regulator [Betaproteobacteria bacterium]